jgi:oxygen-dependent protoporphyrinogen oxidase
MLTDRRTARNEVAPATGQHEAGVQCQAVRVPGPTDRSPQERAETAREPRVAVVGGGIAGLAAAWSLVHDHRLRRVTVLEASPRVGGKLASAELAGLTIDTGAQSLVARRPEAVELVRAVGLGPALQEPAGDAMSVLVEGRLRMMPGATVMGVPTDLTALARSQVLDPQALARIPWDHVLAQSHTGEDTSVGDHIGRRIGPQVVERLVGPTFAGVYAGDVMALSMRATMPALFSAIQDERSLLVAAKSVYDNSSGRTAARRHASGVAADHVGLEGGVGRLPQALITALTERGAEVRTEAVVRGLERTATGWRVLVGSAAEPSWLDVDAVVLAVPAPAASRLLDGLAIGASVHLGEIEYVSVATVTLAYRTVDLAAPDLLGVGEPGPEGEPGEGRPRRRSREGRVSGPGGWAALGTTGFLVGLSEPRAVTAATYASRRWRWLGRAAGTEGLSVVQTSIGRAGGATILQRHDAELVALSHDDLAFALRLGRARPVDAVVARWGGALPQYAVGHVERVDAIRASVAALPGITVCGAAYDGIGIAACIASGTRAATEVASALRPNECS